MKTKTGELDRRIYIQVGEEIPDENNDPVLRWPTDDPPGGSVHKRWARIIPGRSIEINNTDNQIALREADTIFKVRFDSLTSVIAPEISRVLYKPRGGVMQIYQIVGILITGDRHDGIYIATSFRPDQRGDAGPIDGQS